MEDVDLNLLVALDALLAEGSVAKAAERLRLSASAMSRTLSRLQAATGDPLLVRTGRGLVPTPRASELRERVGRLVQEAQAVLRPTEALDLARLETTFSLRTSDGFVDISVRRCWRASPATRRASGCTSSRSSTATPRACATAASTLRPAWSAR